jgi:6,7-dimethyl-8-ribityllumazine synthase
MEIGQYQPNLEGDGLRIGIVQSRFNEPVCNGLADACVEELERLGVSGEDVLLVSVPGALEIPLALQKLAESGQFDALGRDAARVAVEMANLTMALDQLGDDEDEEEDEEDEEERA